MVDVELTSDLLFDDADAWDEEQQQQDQDFAPEMNSQDLEPQEDQEPDANVAAASNAAQGAVEVPAVGGLHARFNRMAIPGVNKLATSAPVKLPQLYRWRGTSAAEEPPVEPSPERPSNTFVPLHIKDVPAEERFGTSYEKRPLKMFALREKRLRQMGWYEGNVEAPKPWAGLNEVVKQWNKQ